MHTQSDAIESSLKVLKKKFTGPLFAYPDSGYFKSPNWQFENIISNDALKQFAENSNKHTPKFFRFINEVPTILLIAIIFIVIFKPI